MWGERAPVGACCSAEGDGLFFAARGASVAVEVEGEEADL